MTFVSPSATRAEPSAVDTAPNENNRIYVNGILLITNHNKAVVFLMHHMCMTMIQSLQDKVLKTLHPQIIKNSP